MLDFLFNKGAGLQARNFMKKRLQHKCFPMKFATFLRTPILKNMLPGHPGLLLGDYALGRVDHPDNVKRGGVCICYKSCLPSRVLNISRLNKCVILEIK